MMETIRSGQVFALYLFGVAEGIDLQAAADLVAGSVRAKLEPKPPTNPSAVTNTAVKVNIRIIRFTIRSSSLVGPSASLRRASPSSLLKAISSPCPSDVKTSVKQFQKYGFVGDSEQSDAIDDPRMTRRPARPIGTLPNRRRRHSDDIRAGSSAQAERRRGDSATPATCERQTC